MDVVVLLFTVATLAVYVFGKSLKYADGRCEFMFLLAIFFLHAFGLLSFDESHDFHVDAQNVAFIMASLWTLILIFDVWSTIR